MKLHFTKMEGLGNDYIYINCMRRMIFAPNKLAVRLSDRHFGVGADGLILIRPSVRADFMMDMYNADGSRSEMCGNGIRCVGKYVYDHGLTDKKHLTIDTLSGVKRLKLITDRGGVSMVVADMGAPIFKPRDIPVLTDDRIEIIKNKPVKLHGRTYNITCVSMGNPHCVIFTDDIDDDELIAEGAYIERADMFPRRTNVLFVKVISTDLIRLRVWERGTGETMACGTGACAALAACVINGKTGKRARVLLNGGSLNVAWNMDKNRIYMTGPANTVYDGVIHI